MVSLDAIGAQLGSIAESTLPWTTIAFHLGAVSAGIWAIRKSKVFRETRPYLNVTQAVSHRRISERIINVHVIVNIHNPSRVKVAPTSGYCVLEGIASELGDKRVRIDQRDWEQPGFLEPGESHKTFFNFAISNDYPVVQSYVHIANPSAVNDSGSKPSDGWNDVAIIDIA